MGLSYNYLLSLSYDHPYRERRGRGRRRNGREGERSLQNHSIKQEKMCMVSDSSYTHSHRAK